MCFGSCVGGLERFYCMSKTFFSILLLLEAMFLSLHKKPFQIFMGIMLKCTFMSEHAGVCLCVCVCVSVLVCKLFGKN
jgi:hypothetical protein